MGRTGGGDTGGFAGRPRLAMLSTRRAVEVVTDRGAGRANKAIIINRLRVFGLYSSHPSHSLSCLTIAPFHTKVGADTVNIIFLLTYF